jgi:hypothetical protein
MLSPLRNRFGIPGVISVIALVFAMLGGAYAASNDSKGAKATVSAKGKPGPRGPKGKTGPAGPAGPAGPEGAKGDAGVNGADGKDGTSLVTEAFGSTGKDGKCVGLGGTKLIGSTITYVCNGKAGKNGAEGSPWTELGTLPSEQTETGTFLMLPGPFNTVGAVSFPIPLEATLAESGVLSINGASSATEKEQCDDGEGETASTSNPEADPGKLCVFPASGQVLGIANPATFETGAGKTGALLFYNEEKTMIVGTWAVTAP